MKTKESNSFMGKPIIRINVVIKLMGCTCNLECDYCSYVAKKNSSKDGCQKMSYETLEATIKEFINAQNSEKITFSWQCKEPDILGIDFFKKIIELQKKYTPGYSVCENLLQMNGTLIDEKWCKFLKENNFRVEIGIDGPSLLHNKYHKDNEGKGTFDEIIKAIELLKKYKVQFNSRTCINCDTTKYPLEVYRFLRDRISADSIELIPIVEVKKLKNIFPLFWKEKDFIYYDSEESDPNNKNSILNHWSVKSEEYGDFLIAIFDEWYKEDLGKIFVPIFESAIRQWMGGDSSLCSLSLTCGKTISIEYNGDVHCCDQCINPEYKLGNIKVDSLINMVLSEKQHRFKNSKCAMLSKYCNECKWLRACNGGCLKNRILKIKDSDLGINYLCKGLKKYFEHIDPYISDIVEKMGREVDIINPNWKG